MEQNKPQVRYHSLDALRAWAMLLGIVLHAAWILQPHYLFIPIADRDQSVLFGYPFSLIHMFRMQVFFLMAGFFAHLVVRKRGRLGFVWHRLSRIGIPLLIGWLILCPVMLFQYTWGGMASGRILSDAGVGEEFRRELLTGALFNPTNLYHLWFLYDLMLVYACTLVGLVLLDRLFDRQGRLRHRIDRVFRWTATARWGLVLLIVPSACLLYFESNWWGLSALPLWFIPELPGFFGYCLFFWFGWLLFAHHDLLESVGRNWRWHLIVGLVLSVPIFAAANHFARVTPPMYPILTHVGILDPSALVFDGHQNQPPQASGAKQRVWNALSPAHQQFLLTHPNPTDEQLFGVAMELNKKIVFNRTFSNDAVWQDISLPADAQFMLDDADYHRNILRNARLNRRLLEATYPQTIMENRLQQPDMKCYKAVFSIAYSVSMWCLVFGLIGCFTHHFSHASPRSRYIADAAYWIYLIHLPIIFQCELMIAQDAWGLWGIPKFACYTLIASSCCLVSYHYLVRSTFVGRTLNGRQYPFVPWPWFKADSQRGSSNAEQLKS